MLTKRYNIPYVFYLIAWVPPLKSGSAKNLHNSSLKSNFDEKLYFFGKNYQQGNLNRPPFYVGFAALYSPKREL